MKSKVRPDALLLELGLADTLEKARSLIMQGVVIAFVEEEGRIVKEFRVEKAGNLLSRGTLLRIKHKKDKMSYVSRGAFKLLRAIEAFDLSFKDYVAIDIGASTGGFTQVLLEHGARKVYAIDSGFNQIDYNLSKDERVISLEGANFRTLPFDRVGEKVDACVADLSFISLEVIFPNIPTFLKDGAIVVTLIKPQFEAERSEVEAGGIVSDYNIHRRVIKSVVKKAIELGFWFKDIVASPIRGTKGNLEYLAYFIYNNSAVGLEGKAALEKIDKVVDYECCNHSKN